MAVEIRIRRYKNNVLQTETYSAITDENEGVYQMPIEESSDEDEIRVALVDAGSRSTLYSDEKCIDVEDACDNPVNLCWIDTLGGMQWWVFEANQEYTYVYADGKKATRKRLYAYNLSLNQWETLNELNTIGEIYRNNITELTTTVNKTSSRIGQQVYATDEDDNTVGVIVIPTENSTFTKQNKHSIEITIEYPEIFTQ